MWLLIRYIPSQRKEGSPYKVEKHTRLCYNPTQERTWNAEMLRSKFEEFFGFTTFYTTFGRKETPRYTAICHRDMTVRWRKHFKIPG